MAQQAPSNSRRRVLGTPTLAGRGCSPTLAYQISLNHFPTNAFVLPVVALDASCVRDEFQTQPSLSDRRSMIKPPGA